ncbi:hypothetical protein IV454_31275 [Massilia antarctica]|uniref:Glycerophosphoryl diester phosphodiesterase membrane domain-containing protein n=1 Tax=Massilia antarctica TaxID=2765360 RepID=A0AA48WC57_9BURK|nr:DUF6159 family protein [Massilia antarctica]QPI49841.1 hypothetical protein IV454_31275 [Massilia antarctica]
MFERFTRSFDLVKASAVVLRQDSHLLMFPLISGAASLAVVLAFMLPAFGLGSFDGIGASEGAWYGLAFLFYVSQYCVMFYFNAALVGATLIRMDGGAPTLGDGMRIANSRFGTILGYAVIAATVGVILRAIQERLGFVGRFIVGLIGVGWTVATFLVVPVLVARDTGPIESIKQSAALLKQTWGENVVGQSGMSLFFGMLMFLVVLVTLSGVGLGITVGSTLLAGVAVAFGVLGGIVILLTHNALSGIYAATLYRYAASGNAGNGFDQSVLNAAFAPKV